MYLRMISNCHINCHICLYMYCRQRLHTGKKPYNGECCGVAFKPFSTVEHYMLVSVFAFTCIVKNAMLRRKQTGEEPYKGEVCVSN